jgi:molybdenum-dependent DNA-binding transcriptional regulator ModE
MQMNQIRYFLALCEERNFTRAAKRCGVSQPSLTNAIKRLEQTLGGPLFHRDRRNIELTELGRLVKPYLKQLNQSAYEAKRKAAKVLSAPSITHQPRAMEAFMRAHHVIAVVAVLVIGLGAKQFVFPPQQADADINAVPSASVNVHQMLIDHPNRNNFPAQKMHDMTFVFSAPD